MNMLIPRPSILSRKFYLIGRLIKKLLKIVPSKILLFFTFVIVILILSVFQNSLIGNEHKSYNLDVNSNKNTLNILPKDERKLTMDANNGDEDEPRVKGDEEESSIEYFNRNVSFLSQDAHQNLPSPSHLVASPMAPNSSPSFSSQTFKETPSNQKSFGIRDQLLQEEEQQQHEHQSKFPISSPFHSFSLSQTRRAAAVGTRGANGAPFVSKSEKEGRNEDQEWKRIKDIGSEDRRGNKSKERMDNKTERRSSWRKEDNDVEHPGQGKKGEDITEDGHKREEARTTSMSQSSKEIMDQEASNYRQTMLLHSMMMTNRDGGSLNHSLGNVELLLKLLSDDQMVDLLNQLVSSGVPDTNEGTKLTSSGGGGEGSILNANENNPVKRKKGVNELKILRLKNLIGSLLSLQKYQKMKEESTEDLEDKRGEEERKLFLSRIAKSGRGTRNNEATYFSLKAEGGGRMNTDKGKDVKENGSRTSFTRQVEGKDDGGEKGRKGDVVVPFGVNTIIATSERRSSDLQPASHHLPSLTSGGGGKNVDPLPKTDMDKGKDGQSHGMNGEVFGGGEEDEKRGKVNGEERLSDAEEGRKGRGSIRNVGSFNGAKVMDTETTSKTNNNKSSGTRANVKNEEMERRRNNEQDQEEKEEKKDGLNSPGKSKDEVSKSSDDEMKQDDEKEEKYSGYRKRGKDDGQEEDDDSNHFQVSGKSNVPSFLHLSINKKQTISSSALSSSLSAPSSSPRLSDENVNSKNDEKDGEEKVKKDKNGKEGRNHVHPSSSSFSSFAASSSSGSSSLLRSNQAPGGVINNTKGTRSTIVATDPQSESKTIKHEAREEVMNKSEDVVIHAAVGSGSMIGERHDHGHYHSKESSLNHEILDLSVNESRNQEKELKDKQNKDKMKLASMIISTQYHPSHNVSISGHNLTENKAHSDDSSLQLSISKSINSGNSKPPLCPLVPPLLVGRVKISLQPNVGVNMTNIIKMNPKVALGGKYSPQECSSRSHVAVIIPFRDRQKHLETLLYYLHPVLQRQQISYAIYVIEQFGDDTFNKGVLMNAGVIESMKEDSNIECFIFHDVDLIPEDDRNLYNCPTNSPRHMSPAIDKFNYTLPYDYLVGGVLAISHQQYKLVNGYSNLYWGWGGEDDDIAHRMSAKRLKIIRPPNEVGRYKMIKHNHRKESPSNVRSALLRMAKRRASRDGLSSVHYEIKKVQRFELYTKITIEIGHIHKWHFPSPNKLVLHF